MRTSNKRQTWSGVVLLVLSFVAALPVMSADSPSAGQSEHQYRVGYLEAGMFRTFSESLKAIERALEKMGWKDRIQFPRELHFSPGWEPEKKEELHQRARELMSRKDVDLIIAAGSDATEAILKANNGRTPILAMSVADAVRSGFVLSEKDSGIDNFTVRIEPGRYLRMFRLFHEVIGFKRLGLMYSDTENGRKYTSLDDAREVAKEKGFEIIEYKKIGRAETPEQCLEGLQWLIEQKIDAFFIPALICFDLGQNNEVGKMLDLLTEEKIPTFAREGTDLVKTGSLMSCSTIDFDSRGSFLADKVVRILQGEKPRSLPMVDRALPKVSLNLNVAQKIGVEFPSWLKQISDEKF